MAAVNVNGTGPFSFAVVGKPGGSGEFCTWKYICNAFIYHRDSNIVYNIL